MAVAANAVQHLKTCVMNEPLLAADFVRGLSFKYRQVLGESQMNEQRVDFLLMQCKAKNIALRSVNVASNAARTTVFIIR